MKYLCLAYEGEDTFNDMPVAEWEAVREETLAYVEALKRSGQLIDARPLRAQPPRRRSRYAMASFR